MKILGIEYGSWSVKAVEVETRFRSLEVLDLHEIQLPLEMSDPLQSYKDAVSRLLSRLPSHPEKIVTAIPASQTALRFFHMPVKQRKKAEQMFRFDLEDSIPFKLEDSILDHQISKVSDGSMVFAALAPIKHLQSHLQWLKATGIDPDWLTFEGMGLINLYLQMEAEMKETDRPEGPTLLMDIGHTKTTLAFIHENTLEFLRTIAWGGFTVTQTLAKALNITLEEAEQFKTTKFHLGKNDNTSIFFAASKSFEGLLTDIQHSFAAFRTLHKKEVQSLLITGGAAETKGITEFLSRNLNRPVKHFTMLKGIQFAKTVEHDHRIRFAEALGRALVFTRKSALLFNFRKNELNKATSITAVSNLFQNPNVVKLARYFAVLLAILCLYVIGATQAVKKDARVRRQGLEKVFMTTFMDMSSKTNRKQKIALLANPANLRKFLDKRNRELDTKLKMLSKDRTPMLDIILALSNAFPEDVRVDVNNLELDDRRFKLEGVLYSGKLETITQSLKQLPMIAQVNVTEVGKRFTFEGDIKGR